MVSFPKNQNNTHLNVSTFRSISNKRIDYRTYEISHRMYLLRRYFFILQYCTTGQSNNKNGSIPPYMHNPGGTFRLETLLYQQLRYLRCPAGQGHGHHDPAAGVSFPVHESNDMLWQPECRLEQACDARVTAAVGRTTTCGSGMDTGVRYVPGP